MRDSYQDGRYLFKLHEGLEGLLEIRDDWNDLFAKLERPAYYQDWRWMYAVVKWLITTPVYFAVLRDGNETVVILPLQTRKMTKGGIKHDVVGFPTHSHIVLSDLICDPTKVDSPDLDSLITRLSREKKIGWSVLDLSAFSSDSQICRLLGSGREGVREKSKSAYFSIVNGDYQNGLSKKFIKNIRRLESKASREVGPVTANIEEANRDLADLLEIFLEMEASGWKGEKGTSTAIKHDDTLVAFYKELVSLFSEDNRLAIHVLSIDGVPAASQLCIRFDAVWYLLKIAYNEDLREYGAGNLLMLQVLDAASGDSAIDELNLVTAPDWSSRWHLENRDVYGYQAFNTNIKGRLTRVVADARKKVKSLTK